MRRNQTLIWVLILILAATIGLFIWHFYRPQPQTQAPTATSTASGVAPSAPQLTNAAAGHVIENGQYFTIDLQYPSATPLAQTAGSAADEAAVAELKNYSEQEAASFIKNLDLASITPTIAENIGLSTTTKFSLTSTYEGYTSPTTVSYVFTIYSDTLGAHPNTTFASYTFSLKTGATLSLADLFTPGTDYLGELSSISRKMLLQQQSSVNSGLDEKIFIDPGTAPTAANFKSFALDSQYLYIFFAPYQVAPYALGPQIVKIPVSQLQGFTM